MASFAEAGVRMVAKDIGKFENDMEKADRSVGGFAKNAVKNGGKMALAFGASMAGVGLAVGAVSVNAAIEFESAWAGVMKTTDGLGDSVNDLTAEGKELQDGFRDLAKEVPTAVEELMGIGELGGQLGVQKKNLLEFTRVVAALGETTNLSTEEAATDFAQLANIMNTSQDEFKSMASSVVALGNTSATTERDIVSFAAKIAGAGNVAGLTEADVFGISAAFSSVGIQANAGGTATSKAILDMSQAAINGGEKMEIFAALAGIEAENFGAAWEEDAGAVFAKFVEGLGIAGDDAGAFLDELEIKDAQAVRAFLSLSGAGDLVTKSLETSNKAFEEGTALTIEAETRYQTTEAQMQIFKNTIKDVGISIGQALLPFINDLLTAAKPLMASFGKKIPGVMKKIVPIIKSLVKFGGKLISIFSGLVKGIVHVFKEGELLHMGW
jgi:TP901 family phage tail tape measure protein